jgi:hypothetical protein
MEPRRISISKRRLIKRNKRRIRLIKIFFCILFPCIVITTSTVVSFADMDVNALLTEWYNKKIYESKAVIENAVNTELSVQKAKLRTQIQEALVASNRDLDEYTKNEKEKSLNKLIDYANALSNTSNISNDADKKQIDSKLNSIVNSARLAMENLKQNYIPPIETFTAKKVDIKQTIVTELQPETTSQPDVNLQPVVEVKEPEANSEEVGAVLQQESTTQPGKTIPPTIEDKQTVNDTSPTGDKITDNEKK